MTLCRAPVGTQLRHERDEQSRVAQRVDDVGFAEVVRVEAVDRSNLSNNCASA